MNRKNPLTAVKGFYYIYSIYLPEHDNNHPDNSPACPVLLPDILPLPDHTVGFDDSNKWLIKSSTVTTAGSNTVFTHSA